MPRLAPIAAALILLPLAKDAERPLDRILLRNGKELEGHVLVDRGAELVLGQGRKRKVLDRADVSEVLSAWRTMPEFLERYAAADQEGPRGWIELADYCDSVGLEREAKLASYLALLRENEPEGVHARLGSRQRKQEWSIRWGSDWMGLEQWRGAETMRWSQAPQLDSSFFRVTSNSPARQTLETFGMLHFAHLGWFRFVGDTLRQEHRTGLFEVALHGDERSYAAPLGNPPAFYDRADDRIEIDGLRDPLPSLVQHEIAHQMLAELIDQRVSKGKVVPAWLDEGLAEILARVLAGRGGFDASHDWLRGSAHYRALRGLERAPELEALFARSGAEFHGAAEPWVPYGLAYSLVVVCLGEEDSDRRDRFFAFVDRLIDDRADSDDLAKALGLTRESLILEWHESLGFRDGERR